MKIILGADHGGFETKEKVKEWLMEQKYDVSDIGAEKLDPLDDYVDYAAVVAEEVAENSEARGLLFCRNGFGMMIAANRFSGVRCGLAFDEKAVKKGRGDDDINCLAVANDYFDEKTVREMIKIFLETDFSGEEKYRRRLWKLEMLKNDGCCGGGCGGCSEC